MLKFSLCLIKHHARKTYGGVEVYLLTPWCRVLLEKLTGSQLVKTFPAFYGTRKFITVLTSFHHLSLSWTTSIQSINPHTTSWRFMAAAVSEPALYRLLTFQSHVPFQLFRLYQRISPVPRHMYQFRNKDNFCGQELLAPRPTPQAGGPLLVGCQRLLILYIRSYPPYWKPFLHPQPEDVPCLGDRDPLITDVEVYKLVFVAPILLTAFCLYESR